MSIIIAIVISTFVLLAAYSVIRIALWCKSFGRWAETAIVGYRQEVR